MELEELRHQNAVFAPVHSLTAFEETVDRLRTAIRLGLLPPGTRLPAERELCTMLGIARSTLRQALIALAASGHLRAVRGRGGGTFVADPLPPAEPPPLEVLSAWGETCDQRMVIEVGVATLASERASPTALDSLDELVAALDNLVDDFTAYRHTDVRLHVGLAEATGSGRLILAMTAIQGEMTQLTALGAHRREALLSSNLQHRRILAAIRRGDGAAAATEMAEHLRCTERVLAGLMPVRVE